MIKEKAYAKLNLSLKVISKMENGFHELESIMVPVVDLYDELFFEENDTEEFILLDNEIENNSIIKAAKAFQQKYKTKGAKIRLVKRIPLEAGLAGGSADSSATLRGLNRLFNLNIPLIELEDLAKQLGSDNVFCLHNKAAICRGRGELLEFIDSDFQFEVLLIKPSFGLLTKDVFNNLLIKKSNHVLNNIKLALKTGDYELLDNNIFNDLLEPALKIEPQLQDVMNKIKKHNVKCHMSGSGSTLYVICNKKVMLDFGKDEIEYVYLKKHLVKSKVND